MRSVGTIPCLAAAAVLAAGCDSAQLVAPIESNITISAGARVVPPNGNTSITAVVTEEAGTPVQNGTTVTFTATVGRVDPVQAQTRNGIASSTYFAGSSSGVARVQAVSGAAAGGEDGTNVVEITVGAAAVNAVTLRANPGSVGPNGGSVELIASVVAENGQPLSGIAVTFSTDQGSLSATEVITNGSGEARTELTTTQQATVSATAGTKTSANVTVSVRSGPVVSISCAPASGDGNCAAVQPSGASNTATVLFTVTRASGSSTLRTATIDFGDGTSQNLGNLAAGTATVTHVYAGPSGSTPASYTATVEAVDINGESATASTTVGVTFGSPISVSVADNCATATTTGQRCTFTATVTGGGEGTTNAPIQSYTWNFGDDSDEVTTSGNAIAHVYTVSGTFTVTVTVRAADGRTATGRTDILVKLP